jgi:hypothetical protein
MGRGSLGAAASGEDGGAAAAALGAAFSAATPRQAAKRSLQRCARNHAVWLASKTWRTAGLAAQAALPCMKTYKLFETSGGPRLLTRLGAKA